MATHDIIMAAAGSAATTAATYVEDVFSTYLYTGTGASQTITNGIDLSTKGGLVWTRNRSGATYPANSLFDTSRGAGKALVSDSTSAQQAGFTQSYLTTGFSLGGDNYTNQNSQTYASWTFRKAAKFFDIVTYTGTGSARTISHSLGSSVGMVIVKRTDNTGDWKVYHSGLTSASYSCNLNTTNSQISDSTVWSSTAPTSSVFSVGTHADVNASGGTYVAYLFAASSSGGFGAAGSDSVVACGSYTGNGSASGPSVTLGWEPQFVLVKMASSTGDWNIFDNMRGIPTGAADPYLFANTNGVEATTNGDLIDIKSTGFTIKSTNAEVNTSSGTYIYLAIRRGPMKTPTDATKVFAPFAVSDDTVSQTTGFPVDMYINTNRAGNASNSIVFDRLRGIQKLSTALTDAEVNTGLAAKFQSNTSFLPGYFGTANCALWAFRRAPGFFDAVCFRGTGAAQYVSHNLGVSPQLIIIKNRTGSAYNWAVWSSVYTNGRYNNYLDNNQAVAQNFEFNSSTTNPNTSTTFYLQWLAGINTNNVDYVAYLFASCPGVSKIGSYTGNGSSQTIDCGFAAGARFVLIKRTDSTGDWYVWDTARGIVSANDPHLSPNTTSAEVTTDDTIDPDSTGFIVNQVSATNVNVSSATYIYLAIA